MPSSKSKKKKKKKGKMQKHLERIRSELLETGLCRLEEILENPPGEEKMSEVLMRFVEPYAKYAACEEDFETLYSVASLAWNAALLPDRESNKFDDLVEEYAGPGEDETRLIINELIHRKKRYFAEYSRIILKYDVKMIGREIYVSVASTLPRRIPFPNG